MNVINEASTALSEFLANPRQKVFVLKGPWGAGKSFFMRKFVKEHKETLPDFVSYVSVFGLRDVWEVKNTVAACLDGTAKGKALKWGQRISKALARIRPSVGIVSLELPDLSRSAFWHIARKFGLLVILDDLERAHEDLDIKELLGLASNLAENSRAQVVLIFNEDRLEADASGSLCRYREKVVDIEFDFRPNPQEQADQFLNEKSLATTVAECLTATGGANIRLIRRIDRSVAYLRAKLAQRGWTLNSDDLAHVAQLTTLFYATDLPIDTHTFERFSFLGFHTEKETANGLNKSEKDLIALTRELCFLPKDLDALVLEFLTCGYCSAAAIERFIAAGMPVKTREEYGKRLAEAQGLMYGNFITSEEQVIEAFEGLVRDFMGDISYSNLLLHCEFLKGFGRPVQHWVKLWLDTHLQKLDIVPCQECLSLTEDEQCKKMLAERLATLRGTRNPRAILKKIVSSSSWNHEDASALATKPLKEYVEWFSTDGGPDLLADIRRLLEMWAKHQADSSEAIACKKMRAAVQQIGESSRINRLRAANVLRTRGGRASSEGAKPGPQSSAELPISGPAAAGGVPHQAGGTPPGPDAPPVET